MTKNDIRELVETVLARLSTDDSPQTACVWKDVCADDPCCWDNACRGHDYCADDPCAGGGDIL